MKIQTKEFNKITLIPSKKRYYPASVNLGRLDKGNYIKHTDIDIPMGKSRYGGPIADLPTGVRCPKGMYFAGQLDLNEIARFDTESRLPTSGHLIFFANIRDECHVVYSDTPNDSLQRVITEHEEQFWDGVLIEDMKSEVESMTDCYREPEEYELDCYECEEDFRTCDCNSEYNEVTLDQVTADGEIWNDFAGAEQSKMFGFFNHCQWTKKEVEEVVFSDKVVLLQIGEKGFTEAGVFIILIDKEALKNKDFSACTYYWSQS